MATQHPLRILLSSYRSNPTTGGQGIFLYYLSKALIQRHHKVTVISGPPYPTLDKKVQLITLPSLDLYAQKNPMKLHKKILTSRVNFFEWLSYNSGGFPEPYTFGERLKNFVQANKNNYDVIIDNQSLSPGILKISRMGLPTLSVLHHPISRDRSIEISTASTWSLRLLKRRWYHFVSMQKRIARQLPAIVVPSHSTANDAHKDFAIKRAAIHVVSLGIDSRAFCPMPNIPRQNYTLMTVASADVPLKGLTYLLKSFAVLRKKYPKLKLVVVGSLRQGPTTTLMQKLGIAKHVNFTGTLSQQDIVRHYARSTLFVCPSVYEGFGLPVGEAMASGIPVVATNGGALPEVVGDAGVIVKHSSAKELTKAITTLLNSPKKRKALGDQSRARVKNKFNWNLCAKNLEKVMRTFPAKSC